MTDITSNIIELSVSNIDTIFHNRFLFFMGKGGVGKTSIASATAISLAQKGKRVLLISTDPASNLDETLGINLTNHPQQVPSISGLKALNINPNIAAEEYRSRVIAPMLGKVNEIEIAGLREQLSGACTVEIAAFDEFSFLITDSAVAKEFDTIVFDTAPTGHTLRLLSLPKAWTGFFDLNERGASCIGPHSALKTQESRFAAALAVLQDPALTAVVLVARPEWSTLLEAERSSQELKELAMSNQILVINGVFIATNHLDPLSRLLETKSKDMLAKIPSSIRKLPTYFVSLKPFNTVGLLALNQLFQNEASEQRAEIIATQEDRTIQPTLSLLALVDELVMQDSCLVLVMGKGGVGKTTIAAALAVAVAKRGKQVHLSTTDPAAHLAQTIEGSLPQLTVSKINPKEETKTYIEKILASKSKSLDEDGLALLREDLASPCTEEVAVFHAFSKTVFEARRGIVILDTAPTGHTLLLLDAAGSYHREMLKKFQGTATSNFKTPLMLLQDPKQSKILIVTLAETTPVSEAAALQNDLRRASIEPFGWIVNKSLAASLSSDPILMQRAINERIQIEKISHGLATRFAVLPLMSDQPVGLQKLLRLLELELK